jgi:hypothetical protein
MILQIRWLLPLAALALTGCGGTADLTCDEEMYYQKAKLGKPREPRPEGSPCFDRPPQIQLGT